MIVKEQVVFYLGLHMPFYAHRFDRAMLSVNILEKRKSNFKPPEKGWILDSGAFTRLVTGRGHMDVEDYAALISRWAEVGRLDAAVQQDYMCEDFALEKTGLSVGQHQRLTTERWLALRDLVDEVYVMPVIQGYAPSDYADHTLEMSPHLPENAWVGVGSVCRRNSQPAQVYLVLEAIQKIRPDLRLHAFGLKTTALRRRDIALRLHSSDSMAWSYRGRRAGRGLGNSPDFAHEWKTKIENMPLEDAQLTMDVS